MKVEVMADEDWEKKMQCTQIIWKGSWEVNGESHVTKLSRMPCDTKGVMCGEGKDRTGSYYLELKAEEDKTVKGKAKYDNHSVELKGSIHGAKIERQYESDDGNTGRFNFEFTSDAVEGWQGSFNQDGTDYPMNLALQINPKGVFGLGSDEVGNFVCTGYYDTVVLFNEMNTAKQD